MYWKSNSWSLKVYDSCRKIKLPEGLLVSQKPNTPVEYMKSSVYHQKCYGGTTPVLNTNLGKIMNKFSGALPIVRESWDDYTANSPRGSFAYSVTPIVYSVSILAVVTWFLTVFVLTNYTIRPSPLLRLSMVLSSGFLFALVTRSIVLLHEQQQQGYLSALELLDVVNKTTFLNVLDLVAILFLQISQVQVIMRIFLRQSDKRVAFYVGTAASIASQVIWGVSKFKHFDDSDEAKEILPAFTYLVRMAMSVCYAALITVFQLLKMSYLLPNKGIWVLTVLTMILIYTPVAFFVADVANAWMYELSEVFSVVTYVICVVIPWEWCNKLSVIMRAKEKEGILGRKFYEDEMFEVDRMELFVDEEGLEPPKEPVEPPKSSKVKDSITHAKHAFLSFTDHVIATGLAIPRSVSAGSPMAQENSAGASHPERRRDVFVYSTKEVVVGNEGPDQH